VSLGLVVPSRAELPGYVDAVNRGWSPDNTRPDAGREQLPKIEADADAFLAGLDDPEGRGPPITLPDGSVVQRLPGYHRWLWDGEFCGSIGFRWSPGTSELPEHVLGHIGYAVVPWKRRRGYATEALRLLLPEVRARGLAWVELTTDTDNAPSQQVITANGGRLLGRFAKPEAFGGAESLRFRIDL
jgi:predicted acetyltransferase